MKSFQYGKTAALLTISEELNFVEIVNRHTDKKKIKGLTVGEYLLLNIIGRCDRALSENAMQKWFKKSSLSILWRFPHKLTCQNFLNHYKYLDVETCKKIGDDLCKVLVEKGIAPKILFLDESNWFTYIEKVEKLPQKGKSKQFRSDKNLVSVGLAVSEDNVPFMHETYEGNKHDAKIFPELLDALTERLSNLNITTEHLVLVFDKGNNSKINIGNVLNKMHLVASAKHNQAKDLLKIPLEKYEYLYTNPKSHKVYRYRTKYEFFEEEFTTVVTYNEASYKKQRKSYEEKKSKILANLADLKRRLESNRGKGRTISSVESEVNEIIYKDFKAIVGHEVGKVPEGKKKPTLEYWMVVHLQWVGVIYYYILSHCGCSKMGRRGPKPGFNDVACPNEDCDLYGVAGKGNVIGNGTYNTKSGRVQKYICHACGRVFCSRTNTAFYDLRTEEEKILLALKLVLKGMSLRGIAEVLEVSAETVSRWLSRAAEHSEEVNKKLLKDLNVSKVELDELWTIVKKKKLPELKEGEDSGNWVWTSMISVSRLVVAHAVGERKQYMADKVVGITKERIASRPLFVTDGLKQYPKAGSVPCFL